MNFLKTKITDIFIYSLVILLNHSLADRISSTDSQKIVKRFAWINFCG